MLNGAGRIPESRCEHMEPIETGAREQGRVRSVVKALHVLEQKEALLKAEPDEQA